MVTDLKSQLTLLKSFQDMDAELRKFEEELASIPSLISEAGAEYKDLLSQIDSKKAQKMAFEKDRKNKELDIESETTRIKERESKLYAIKTNKEYQAALKEIADSKMSSKEHEEGLIALMEQIELISEEITQLSSGLADKEDAFRKAEAEIKKKEEVAKAELSKWQQEIKEIESKLDREVLSHYRLIRGKYNDAMAVATGSICQGCYKRIPPQMYIELQKWKEVISCPNCHRILFFEASNKPEEAA